MDDLTRLPSESASVLTSSGSDWGRFAPGTLFAGRFRTSLRSASAAWASSTALMI
jgi:hypothetical protein